MPFSAPSRRQVAAPSKRRSRHTKSINTPKVSSSSLSPHELIRSESLRSTWMTNDSDYTAEDDRDMDDENIAQGNCNVLQLPLSDWVYWQRDAVALPDCWTRVFAVFSGNHLWLYRYEDASARSLLVRMHVAMVDVGADARQLQFRDAAASVQLCFPDTLAFDCWHHHVTSAVTSSRVVEDDNAAIVPIMTSTVQKKSFWKAFATAVLKGTKNQGEDNAIMLYDGQGRKSLGQGRKSLGQRWKKATTFLTSALKFDRQYPQLQV